MSIRLCVGEYASVGFEPEGMGIKIYSLEELVFFIRENAVLLDDSFMDESLGQWLAEECKLQELGDELRRASRKRVTLKTYVGILLEYAGFYTKDINAKIESPIAENSSLSVYEKKKVTLDLNERLKRTLISSVGKLESIKRIADNEVSAMGERLRMLILTDYIKKENLAKIASAEEFNSVNIVSIFETIRRANLNVNIGVLSGSLVILPKTIDLSDVKHKKEDIANTDYCTVEFAGALHRGVDYVGKLFEEGKIQILIGTKSLLGEGWDSPCINSLILASFVGSFMLSNQMRGRAIRIDKNNPDKISNIWHLSTVEPSTDGDNSTIAGDDFETIRHFIDMVCFIRTIETIALCAYNLAIGNIFYRNRFIIHTRKNFFKFCCTSIINKYDFIYSPHPRKLFIWGTCNF